MRITELKTYNDAAFENSDNIARIHGFVSYAPLTDFRPDSDWFTREDGTIAAMSVRFKEGKTWLRAPHVIYSTSKGTSQNRDIQGISYKTVLSGIYAAHSAALINELHQAALLKLAVFVNTPSGSYIIGNPTHPVRLNFNFNTAEKYRLEWTQFSSLPFRGLETLPIIVDVGGLDPTLVSLLPVMYPSDTDALADSRLVGDYYELSETNMYTPTGGFIKRLTNGVSSLNSYSSDGAAFDAGLTSGSYYELSESNIYLPTSGFIRRIPGGTISGLTTGISSRGVFDSDNAAFVAGLPVGAIYELSASNMYLGAGGFLKTLRQP